MASELVFDGSARRRRLFEKNHVTIITFLNRTRRDATGYPIALSADTESVFC